MYGDDYTCPLCSTRHALTEDTHADWTVFLDNIEALIDDPYHQDNTELLSELNKFMEKYG